MKPGRIVQVVGAVVDVEFEDSVPGIHHALTVDFEIEKQPVKLTLEVQQQLGDRSVRTIAMSSTEGLERGLHVRTLPEGRSTWMHKDSHGILGF